MIKNVIIVISWSIIGLLLIVLLWMWQGFSKQNAARRNLNTALWQQQVSMREGQVEIATQLKNADPATRAKIMNVLIESARDVDSMRDRIDFDMGGARLQELMRTLEQADTEQHAVPN